MLLKVRKSVILCYFLTLTFFTVVGSAQIEQVVRSSLVDLTRTLEETIKENVLDTMADVLAQVMPRAPRPLDENNLRPFSHIVPHPSRLQSLRDFLKRPDANFTCAEQAVLLELMCRGEENVLGILGTGKGKTMIVFLYAHLFGHRGVTVVVLPLSALRGEYIRRARANSVSAAVWAPDSSYNADVELLFVSIEHTTNPGFRS